MVLFTYPIIIFDSDICSCLYDVFDSISVTS